MYEYVGICDRCGAEHRVAMAESQEQLREDATRAGWRVIEGHDLCGACVLWVETRS